MKVLLGLFSWKIQNVGRQKTSLAFSVMAITNEPLSQACEILYATGRK
jgi:hypothetical protein